MGSTSSHATNAGSVAKKPQCGEVKETVGPISKAIQNVDHVEESCDTLTAAEVVATAQGNHETPILEEPRAYLEATEGRDESLVISPPRGDISGESMAISEDDNINAIGEKAGEKEEQTDGAMSSSDAEGKLDDDSKKKPPLHRLMVDYKVRKEQATREIRENARKSPRPKRETERFVAGPASIFLDPEKQMLKKMQKRLAKLSKKKRNPSQALERTKPDHQTSKGKTQEIGAEADAGTADQPAEVCEAGAADQPAEVCEAGAADQPAEVCEAGAADQAAGAPMLEAPSNPPANASEFAHSQVPGDFGDAAQQEATDPSAPIAEHAKPITEFQEHPLDGPDAKYTATASSASSKSPGPNERRESSGPAATDSSLGNYFPDDIEVHEKCQGKTFPVQLMLMMEEDIAKESLWWSHVSSGSNFFIDCNFFRDDVMRAFFPNNPFRRITCTLKQWGFQKINLDLPEGILCFHHPLFQRDRPELALKMVYPGDKEDTAQAKQNMPQDGHQEESSIGKLANPTMIANDGIYDKRVDNVLLPANTHIGCAGSTPASGDNMPPAVRIASLRNVSCSSQEQVSEPPSAKVEPPRQQSTNPERASLIPEHLKQQRRIPERASFIPEHLIKKAEVVDLTDDGDDEDEPEVTEVKRCQQSLPPFSLTRHAWYASGQKRKFDILSDVIDDAAKGIVRQLSVASHTSRGEASHTSRGGVNSSLSFLDSFSTPNSTRLQLIGNAHCITPGKSPTAFSEGQAEEYARLLVEEAKDRQLERILLQNKLAMATVPHASLPLKHHMQDTYSSVQQMAMENAIQEEVLRQRKQALEEQVIRTREYISDCERLEEAEHELARLEESQRRKRLAEALYGSCQPRQEDVAEVEVSHQPSVPKAAILMSSLGQQAPRTPLVLPPHVPLVRASSLASHPARSISALLPPGPRQADILGGLNPGWMQQNLLQRTVMDDPMAALLTHQGMARNSVLAVPGDLHPVVPVPSPAYSEASLEQFFLMQRWRL